MSAVHRTVLERVLTHIANLVSYFLQKTVTKVLSREPRWPSGLRRWFANATPRETGFRIPPLPRAEFGRLKLE